MNLCARRARNLLASHKPGSHNLEIEAANYPTHVDLFSGIGGFALAAQWAGFRTIAFCEIDKYCQKVLAKNFGAVLADTDFTRCETQQIRNNGFGNEVELSSSPFIHSNIFDLDGTQFRRNGSSVTLVTGGFPCQPFSVAGKRRGAADDRHLWPEMLRVIKEARPAWVLGENVPGIIPMELDNVLSDLEGIGYATRPFVIPACAVDARHRRDRLWIICHTTEQGLPNGSSISVGRSGELQPQPERSSYRVSNPDDPRLEGRTPIGCNGSIRQRSDDQFPRGLHSNDSPAGNGQAMWLPEPDVGRVAHGIPRRVDRLKGLGNAIVPQVACEILREIRNLI